MSGHARLVHEWPCMESAQFPQASWVNRQHMRRTTAPRNCTLTSNQFEMCAYAGHTSTACHWDMRQLHKKNSSEKIFPHCRLDVRRSSHPGNPPSVISISCTLALEGACWSIMPLTPFIQHCTHGEAGTNGKAGTPGERP